MAGLFGPYKEVPRYSVFSKVDPVPEAYDVGINIMIPLSSINETQILITTIPSVFADWGGAFSAAWAIYYFFFGA
ncbi:hypothetical protein BGX29_004630 [Mortierella sp. GBA35]|nr:hypothetical protein BGX29_004630 [Mortierella sp. GBA35]